MVLLLLSVYCFWEDVCYFGMCLTINLFVVRVFGFEFAVVGLGCCLCFDWLLLFCVDGLCCLLQVWCLDFYFGFVSCVNV